MSETNLRLTSVSRGCNSSGLSRVLGMVGNKSRVRSHTCGSFFTCIQRFFVFQIFWHFCCSLNSFRLVCLCYNVMPRSGRAASNSSLTSAGKSRIITLLGCSSLMLLTSVQSIIPPDHSLLYSCLARYLHTASVLLFIPSYVLISFAFVLLNLFVLIAGHFFNLSSLRCILFLSCKLFATLPSW